MGPRGQKKAQFNALLGKMLRRTAAACALAFALAAAPAHASDTTAAPSEAFILEPLSLVNTNGLDFGIIVNPTVAGTVSLSAALPTVCTPSAGLVRVGSCQAAEFAGLGDTGNVIKVNLPNGSSVELANQTVGSTATMMVTDLNVDGDPGLTYLNGNPASNGFVRYTITAPNGAFVFRIGGTLNVDAGQEVGRYVGNFSITIQYQ